MYPLVSIIIPVYNSERYIAETIHSAINQTWPNKEIILVDDGSTDASLKIVQSYSSNANVRVLTQKNKGASAARNAGLRAAKGDYIQFLDADDLASPDKIEIQLRQLLTQPGKLSICPVIHFNKSGEINNLKTNDYELSFYRESDDPFEFLISLYGGNDNRGGMIPIHSWLIPAVLVKKAGIWNEKLTMNDDGEFFCRVVLASKGVFYASNTYCYYRKNISGGSLSSQKSQAAYSSQLLSLQLIKDHLQLYRDDGRTNKAVARMLTELLYRVYPRYREISGQIEKQIEQLGGTTYQPAIGGRTIELIKKTLGWKVARKLQYYNPLK